MGYSSSMMGSQKWNKPRKRKTIFSEGTKTIGQAPVSAELLNEAPTELIGSIQDRMKREKRRSTIVFLIILLVVGAGAVYAYMSWFDYVVEQFLP